MISDFEDFLDEEFFVIDSCCLEDVKTEFYGFGIQNNEVVTRNNYNASTELASEGAYILIEADDDTITLYQDFMGSYGLFLYQKDDYFAVSNSFLKLVEYLKFGHEMTFNDDYANALLKPKLLCSFAFGETMVNEIRCLERNIILKIDKNTLNIEFEKIDYEENSIYLNTPEGLEILDKWYFKWVEIIRTLKTKTNNISMDLSGGFDTRIIAAIMLSSGIDMNSINIHSITDGLHTHVEDFEIASEISDKFCFKLNQSLNIPTRSFTDIESIINLSCYPKLGFGNQLNFKRFYRLSPLYAITGYAGAILRGFPGGDMDEYNRFLIRSAKKYSMSLEKPVERILTSGADAVKSQYSENAGEINTRYYKETRLRNHFGKLTIEHFLANRISLSPLIDSDLLKLKITTDECDDRQLLITLILLRYCPQLLDFRVEGNREYNSETIEYAKKLNEIKPFVSVEYDDIPSVEETEEFAPTDSPIPEKEIIDYLKAVFMSRSFELEFKKHINPALYEKITESINNSDYFPIQDAVPAFAIVKVKNAINYRNMDNSSSVFPWFDSFLDGTCVDLENEKLLRKYITARIDIKNLNSEDSSIEILEISDLNSKIDTPQWFSDENGIGHVIESSSSALDLKFKCIGEGNLSIKLRAINSRDKNENKFPIYIDFTRFSVDGEEIFRDSKLLSLDDNYVFKKDVNDGDIVSVSVEWMPFSRNSVYVSKEIESLKAQLEEYKAKNNELNDRLNSILNSKSGKVLNKLARF